MRDELRPEVPEVIATLNRRGIGVTMLTGDNARTAAALADQAGIRDVRPSCARGQGHRRREVVEVSSPPP